VGFLCPHSSRLQVSFGEGAISVRACSALSRICLYCSHTKDDVRRGRCLAPVHVAAADVALDWVSYQGTSCTTKRTGLGAENNDLCS